VDSRHAVTSKRTLAQSAGSSFSGEFNSDVCLKELTETYLSEDEPNDPIPGQEISYREMKREGVFKVRKVSLIGWDSYVRTWAESTEFRYPNIFTGFSSGDFVANFMNTQRRTDFTIHYSGLRTARNVVCKVRYEERLKKESDVDLQNVGNCFSFIPADWNYNGTLFNVQLSDLICDSTVISAVSNGDDTFYGYGAESVTLPASSPSFSTLMELIGNDTELLIATKVQPWRFCLFKEIKTFITLAQI
jgi:hypothetical protein